MFVPKTVAQSSNSSDHRAELAKNFFEIEENESESEKSQKILREKDTLKATLEHIEGFIRTTKERTALKKKALKIGDSSSSMTHICSSHSSDLGK